MSGTHPFNVMIAGIGGASLGTEICKTLRLADHYRVYGCDISRTAYGLYEPGFDGTFLVERSDYVSSVIASCKAAGADWLIPGGEQPMTLLGAANRRLNDAGIRLLGNHADVIAAFSDKHRTFQLLGDAGFEIPKTQELKSEADIEQVGLPCIVKPATGSGGSASVFFAISFEEALTYAEFIRRSGHVPIAQEYVNDDEGEFTIGVLSLPDGCVASSVALRRVFDAKLSVAYRGRGGLVSSGYSQGYIGEFQELCEQAERMAIAVGSRGPLNIQGRVRDGVFLPFEINPRFSASTYLRALAGVNEIDMLVRFLSLGEFPMRKPVKAGWYLRSLTERFVPDGALK